MTSRKPYDRQRRSSRRVICAPSDSPPSANTSLGTRQNPSISQKPRHSTVRTVLCSLRIASETSPGGLKKKIYFFGLRGDILDVDPHETDRDVLPDAQHNRVDERDNWRCASPYPAPQDPSSDGRPSPVRSCASPRTVTRSNDALHLVSERDKLFRPAVNML